MWLPSAMVARLASIAERYQKVAGSSPAVVMTWFLHFLFGPIGQAERSVHEPFATSRTINLLKRNNIFKELNETDTRVESGIQQNKNATKDIIDWTRRRYKRRRIQEEKKNDIVI